MLARLVDLEVRSLVTSPPTLEELFLRHYGQDIAVASSEQDAEVGAGR